METFGKYLLRHLGILFLSQFLIILIVEAIIGRYGGLIYGMLFAVYIPIHVICLLVDAGNQRRLGNVEAKKSAYACIAVICIVGYNSCTAMADVAFN